MAIYQAAVANEFGPISLTYGDHISESRPYMIFAPVVIVPMSVCVCALVSLVCLQ